LLRKLGLVVTRRVFVSGLEKRSQSLPIAGVRGALAAMAVLAFTLGAPANLAAETMESALARAYQGIHSSMRSAPSRARTTKARRRRCREIVQHFRPPPRSASNTPTKPAYSRRSRDA
jgi:hypothetical protein